MTGFSTTINHVGFSPNQNDGAVIPPLHLSTTFTAGNKRGYEYSRSGNPTRDVLEKTLAGLEGARRAIAFSSGSAALAAVAALAKSDEAIMFSSDAYGGTYRYFTKILAPLGIANYTADFNDIKSVDKLLANRSIKYIFAESPTNPLLKVVDIAKLAKVAHAHQAILIVDNTFATPISQQPLKHDADIVLYSTTKYINGHSDSVGGSLALNDENLFSNLKFVQNAVGSMMSPFDSWLTLRGLKTLELRMERHSANAHQISIFLKSHHKVRKVYYPALHDGAQAEIVAKQLSLPGGMISIELSHGADIKRFLTALRYFPLAESLGGVESLIDHPASMTHASMPSSERVKIGLSDNLLRISVGIENPEDLIEDLALGLAKA